MSSARDKSILPLEEIAISGCRFKTADLPKPLHAWNALGVVADEHLAAERMAIDWFTCHPRAIEAANGDLLLFFPAGPMHYAWTEAKQPGSPMYLRRSRDRGKTWSEPVQVWNSTYGQHAAIPHRRPGEERIYAIGTEPEEGSFVKGENAAIAMRYSDDHGTSWSPPKVIEPLNAPEFRGMSAMRMDEDDEGTWLVGSHAGTWITDNKVVTNQYLLCSRDQGASWTVLPGYPDGWQTPGFPRMDEGRPIHLGGTRWLFMARTPEGHLWTIRSEDGGRSWSEWEATPLRHLDAPPMLFHLEKGKSLIAFIHNRVREANAAHVFAHELRSELWVVVSHDEGRTWSEPRWLLANACEAPTHHGWNGCTPMVSYADLYVDGDTLHLFVDHQMRQVLHFTFRKEDITHFPTLSELKQLAQ